MDGVKVCPYCGGEVEMVKLVRTTEEKKKKMPQPYRIECRHCRALVARGRGFPIETRSDAEERIKDYNNYMAVKFAPVGQSERRKEG